MTTHGTGRSADETLRETMARLGSAQKGARGAPAYSRFVNRRVGRVLAALAYQAGLTPNMVTGISATLTFSAIALLALFAPTWSLGLVVAGLLLIGYAFDAADGQLARLRGGGSLAGEWLDHMVDATKIASLHLAVLVGLFRADAASERWLLVPIGYSVVSSVLFFATILNEQLRRRAGVTTREMTDGERPAVLRSLLVAPTDYGVLCLAFVFLGATAVFLVVYLILFLATAGYLAAACISWFREINRIGRPAPGGLR